METSSMLLFKVYIYMNNFSVKVSIIIEIPFEDGFLDGLLSKNHLMYIAAARLQDGSTCMNWDGTKGNPIFEYSLGGKPI